MTTFTYTQAASLAEAGQRAAAPEAKLIAGGQSLLGAIKLGLAAPEALIDLSGLADLKGIRVNDEGRGAHVVIGAMTTHAAVAASKEVQQAIPALADLAGRIGDRQVRNRGTLGGSLANNDPAACYPAAVLGLGATIYTDRRSISADDFFLGLFETALQPGEIISSVSFPVPAKASWQKFKQPASRFSLVGVFVAQTAAGVRVAVTGAAAGVFRATELEAALSAKWSQAATLAVSISPEQLSSDLHGSAAYRAALIPVLAGRAVAACS
ncbi:FAD binding domain-containing protein [Roseateles albus]|uniref:Xanthine dehydrogenase family protein subunit M n=1 Tax=Roseateles albus TaxID=2987525 RepID=A0ABT5KHY2_9BURK|nr:xanthine dehydrogenase family protein subunit M [Roseateles albus]MDC8772560.1 xanthine dehydrogenase family protein subunit M [Roseateles albus]